MSIRKAIWLVAFALGSLLFAADAAQAQQTPTIYHVDADASASGTGLSWPQAKKTIQEVLSIPPASGSIIRVAGGVYKPSSQTSSINLVSEVSIQGGYVGQSGLE